MTHSGFKIIFNDNLLDKCVEFIYIIRAKNCKKSDERVSVLTEILNSIKIIKMYCWEIPFTKKVSHLRKLVFDNNNNNNTVYHSIEYIYILNIKVKSSNIS